MLPLLEEEEENTKNDDAGDYNAGLLDTQYTDTDNYGAGITTIQDISSDDTSLTHVPSGKIVTKVQDNIW